VKPYVKRQKNDAADAEAICEAGRKGLVQRRRASPDRKPRRRQVLIDRPSHMVRADRYQKYETGVEKVEHYVKFDIGYQEIGAL
jgi:hypothetical protein